MSTINVKTQYDGIHVFSDATAYTDAGYLIVKDVEDNEVARFSLRTLDSWWPSDD